MNRGRPPLGPGLVDALQAGEESKRRLKLILETLSGTVTIPEACEQLGLSEPAFHKLRAQWLSGAVELLAPRPPGRPAQPERPEQKLIEQMERQIFELKKEAHAARLRAEIAIAMPHLLIKEDAKSETVKKTNPPRKT